MRFARRIEWRSAFLGSAAVLLAAACDGPCGGSDGCGVTVTDWEAMLSGTNHVPPVTTDAAGAAIFHLTSPSTVAYTITISAMPSTAISSATLHQAAAGATTATVAVALCGTGGAGVPACANLSAPGVLVTHTAILSPAQVTVMRAFGMYANVRTAGNPDGEIRGQLRVVAP